MVVHPLSNFLNPPLLWYVIQDGRQGSEVMLDQFQSSGSAAGNGEALVGHTQLVTLTVQCIRHVYYIYHRSDPQLSTKVCCGSTDHIHCLDTHVGNKGTT